MWVAREVKMVEERSLEKSFEHSEHSEHSNI